MSVSINLENFSRAQGGDCKGEYYVVTPDRVLKRFWREICKVDLVEDKLRK